MTRAPIVPRRQRGAYLLEALIGILVFALGVLGIVGLQAASLHTTADSSLRAEAVFAANQLIGQMWTDDRANLTATYGSAAAGAAYTDFASQLKAVQGGAWAQDPTVSFDTADCKLGDLPSNTSSVVFIQIFWQSDTATVACPAAGSLKCHTYTTCGVIGQN